MPERRQGIDEERARQLYVCVVFYFINYNLGEINKSGGLKPLDIVERHREYLKAIQRQDYPELSQEEALVDLISQSDMDLLGGLNLAFVWGELYGAGNRFHMEKKKLVKGRFSH